MFERFLKNNNLEYEIHSNDHLIKALSGRTLKDGAYRIFSQSQKENWEKTVIKAFPFYSGKISIFGYDWLGRIFAENKEDGTVLMFEPGTGEVLEIPVSVEEFHNTEIEEYGDACLAIDFFREWYEKSNRYVLKPSECVGYKVPLFLNGSDDIENLEISDMDVYWTIMSELLRQFVEEEKQ